MKKFRPVIVFCLLGLIIYSNTFHSSFHYDDISSIRANAAIKDISNVDAIWRFWPTRFVTYLSIALNYHFDGLDVSGYHVINILVHIACGIMAWWLTLLTLSTPRMKTYKASQSKELIALFVGLIFIAHPLQTQAVTYIVQRATSLATLFYLSSLAFYVKSRLDDNKPSKTLFYCLSFLSMVIAMFTKEMTITLPIIILIYEAYFLKKEGKGFGWKEALPFLIGLIIIPLTMTLTSSVNFKEMKRVSELPVTISSHDYALTQINVIPTYIRLLLMPVDQNIDYDFPISKTFTAWPTPANLIIIISLLLIAIKLFKRHRLLSFALIWFFITLLPESGVIPISDVIVEHRLYLPMLGFGIFLTGSLSFIFGVKARDLLIGLLIMIIAVYSVLSYKRNFVWCSDFSLWNDTVKKSPNKTRPYNERGNAYWNMGDLKRATADYKKAIKTDPRYAGAYYNLGLLAEKSGEVAKAIAYYSKTLELFPPRAEIYSNRGCCYGDKGDLDNAIKDFSRAIELRPDNADDYVNRGLAYQKKGDARKAVLDYTRAIEIDPKRAVAYNNRAVAYFALNDQESGSRDISKAKALGYPVGQNAAEDTKK